MLGLRHVALNVTNIVDCEQFYVKVLGMKVEWKPDTRSVYLTSGTDNLALHECDSYRKPDSLAHLGFLVADEESVDRWAEYVRGIGISLSKEPRTHRDGARSFYFHDPAGNTIQILYHPPLSTRNVSSPY